MFHLKFFQLGVVLVAYWALVACGQAPKTLCDLPAGRQIWQGVKVDLKGKLVLIRSPSHLGAYFQDKTCWRSVSVATDDDLILGAKNVGTYVADVKVTGSFVYSEGRIVLEVSTLEQKNRWITGADADRYLDNWFDALKQSKTT